MIRVYDNFYVFCQNGVTNFGWYFFKKCSKEQYKGVDQLNGCYYSQSNIQSLQSELQFGC